MTAGLVLFAIGLLGAFFSGLLGVGGAILLIPMLLYLPPLFGLAAFDMVAVGGMTLVQVLAASLAGLLAHRKAGHFSWPVAWPMGLAIAVGATLGALGTPWVPERALQALFAVLALMAVALMLMPVKAEDGSDALPADFRPAAAAAIAGGVGVISGLLGAGGAFLMVPLMRTVLKLPLRLIIGTSLGIVLASAVSGTIAKALTGQIPWVPAAFLVLGALLGAPLGAKVSHRVPTHLLRWGLATAIALTALKMIGELLSGGG